MKRRHRAIPEVLTQDEQARMLGGLEPTNSPGKLRNLAIIRLMLNSGLRARELRELKARNIDWTSGRMKVRGKGRKDRVLWLATEDLALLRDWLAQRPSSKWPSSDLIFTSLDGQKPLCERWLRKMVKRLAGQAGIGKDIHPHTLRHTFATDLYRKTKSLLVVQEALGHQDIETTTIYTHLVNDELEEAMKNLRNGG